MALAGPSRALQRDQSLHIAVSTARMELLLPRELFGAALPRGLGLRFRSVRGAPDSLVGASVMGCSWFIPRTNHN